LKFNRYIEYLKKSHASTNPKRLLFDQFALVAKALANGHRLEILELLAQGKRCVEDLAERAGLEVANTSQHLQHLRRVGLVVARREGKKIFYEVFRPSCDRAGGSLAAGRQAKSG